MKKQLLAVGDSFTYGDELVDHYQAWPYQLADRLGHEVHNMGRSGSSNASILRRTLGELAANHYDLVIIGWTSPGRIEWKDDIGIAYNVWPGYPTTTQFCKDHPWRADLINYISQHHNSSYLYEQYLIQVISLQSYCQLNNIDYRMISVRHNDYYRKVGAEIHEQLALKIDAEKYIGLGEFGMAELTDNLPRGKGGHPLEQGHKRIADEIAKYIRN
jgi:lysophospholipase L1-like esterase